MRRARRVARWVGRAALVLLTLAIIGGLFGTRLGSAQAGVHTEHVSLTVSVWEASLVLSHYTTPERLTEARGVFGRVLPRERVFGPGGTKRWWLLGKFAWRWKLPGSTVGASSSRIVLPLWPAAVAVVLSWVVALMGRLVRRRRRRGNACPACGYSLTGLREGSACPECASVPGAVGIGAS
jgi:hypothetical protein